MTGEGRIKWDAVSFKRMAIAFQTLDARGHIFAARQNANAAMPQREYVLGRFVACLMIVGGDDWTDWVWR